MRHSFLFLFCGAALLLEAIRLAVEPLSSLQYEGCTPNSDACFIIPEEKK
jgi:hypothetical protein